MTLKKQAAKQGLWISVTRTCINMVDFIVFACLARILTLADFGLVAFCMLFIEFANISVNAGVNQNIIQRKTWDEQYASSTMFYVLGLAIFVAAGLVFIGAPIAYYSYSHTAAYVLMSLAPITIILSLQTVFNGKLARDFKNKQMGFAKLIASIVSAIVIITLAELGYGLWSLVIGRLLLATLELTFMSLIAGFKPKLYFNKKDTKELREFCLPLLGSALLSLLNHRASILYTGLVLGPAKFALLNAAKRGESMINQITLSSINSMVVPSFSRVKEGANLGDLYIKLVVITATITMPVFMGLAAIADPFVTILFGDKFSESALFMTISAFGMFTSIIGWFLPTLLISQAKTGDAFKLNILNIVTHVIVAGATIWFGINIMLISIVIAGLLVMPFRFKIVTKHIPIDTKKLVVNIFPPYFSAFAMFAFTMVCKNHLSEIITNDILLLLVLITIGCLSYLVFSTLFFYKHTKLQVIEIKEMFGGRNKRK
jgi:O-antigen/teichoic acid export membrane protein